jgi:hypothetical protein
MQAYLYHENIGKMPIYLPETAVYFSATYHKDGAKGSLEDHPNSSERWKREEVRGDQSTDRALDWGTRADSNLPIQGKAGSRASFLWGNTNSCLALPDEYREENQQDHKNICNFMQETCHYHTNI